MISSRSLSNYTHKGPISHPEISGEHESGGTLFSPLHTCNSSNQVQFSVPLHPALQLLVITRSVTTAPKSHEGAEDRRFEIVKGMLGLKRPSLSDPKPISFY